ncbi:hypothetical protein PoB_000396500 [Plakobranchus ocellatus]|uniref:Uncharacterized protein n=1 Tax=Plakobranchus ocellatus TaxID=259542 RepID=A0AAV3Y3P4_9GAST|nr:hypothetical protein PoB_000396500 [Plakobranchus ocellatus]
MYCYDGHCHWGRMALSTFIQSRNYPVTNDCDGIVQTRSPESESSAIVLFPETSSSSPDGTTKDRVIEYRINSSDTVIFKAYVQSRNATGQPECKREGALSVNTEDTETNVDFSMMSEEWDSSQLTERMLPPPTVARSRPRGQRSSRGGVKQPVFQGESKRMMV